MSKRICWDVRSIYASKLNLTFGRAVPAGLRKGIDLIQNLHDAAYHAHDSEAEVRRTAY